MLIFRFIIQKFIYFLNFQYFVSRIYFDWVEFLIRKKNNNWDKYFIDCRYLIIFILVLARYVAWKNFFIIDFLLLRLIWILYECFFCMNNYWVRSTIFRLNRWPSTHTERYILLIKLYLQSLSGNKSFLLMSINTANCSKRKQKKWFILLFRFSFARYVSTLLSLWGIFVFLFYFLSS